MGEPPRYGGEVIGGPEYEAALREAAADETAEPCTCKRYGTDDPDCELHYPWVIEDPKSRTYAMRLWLAGHETGYDRGFTTGRESPE